MRKIAKLSLVAAVAVAGLTTANAQPLEEAIKNVDVSGTVVYRYNDESVEVANSDSNNTNVNNYKIGVSLKSKITDDVAFNTRVITGTGLTTTSFAALDTNGGDANPSLHVTHANFAYSGIANTTVIVGKQGLQTPWTNAIDSDGSEQTGTGVLALTTMGPVTAAAGYMNQTNISAGNDLTVAALIGKFGPVTAEAWYLDISEDFNQYFVKAAGTVGPVKLYAQYSEEDDDQAVANADDISLLKVGASAKFGMFDAGITYAKTGENGSGIKNAVASAVSAIGYNVRLDGKADATAIFVDAGMKVLPSLHIGLNYDKTTDESSTSNADDHTETFVQVTYSHAKNLSAYVRLADGDRNNVDYSAGRLQVEYKF